MRKPATVLLAVAAMAAILTYHVLPGLAPL